MTAEIRLGIFEFARQLGLDEADEEFPRKARNSAETAVLMGLARWANRERTQLYVSRRFIDEKEAGE